jgi:alkylhydroperoxidase family enzyme
MSRIPLVEPDQATEEQREVFARIEALGMSVFNVMKLWANNAKAAGGFVQIAEALYGSPKLSPRYRELAYLRASQINSCHY